eukprot:6642932-Prymnesium_polylepis.1
MDSHPSRPTWIHTLRIQQPVSRALCDRHVCARLLRLAMAPAPVPAAAAQRHLRPGAGRMARRQPRRVTWPLRDQPHAAPPPLHRHEPLRPPRLPPLPPRPARGGGRHRPRAHAPPCLHHGR